MQLRRLTRADIDAAADLTARVFGRGDQVRAYYDQVRAASLHCPFMPPELCWGVFDDGGRLLAKWQLVELSMLVLGTPLRTAGAFGIAAEPGLRDADVVRRLLAAGHEEVRALGFDLLIGLAARGSIYQRLGGRPVCAETAWEIDALHVPPPQLRCRLVPHAEQSRWLVEVYAQANAARSGTLVRSPELIAFLPRRPPLVLATDDGYVGVRETVDGIEVREVAALHPRFFDLALRELSLRARERGLRRVFGDLPADHGLVHASAKYGARLSTEYPRHSGCMAGVIDEQRLLDQLAPALQARLASSRFAGARVTLAIAVAGRHHRVALGAADVRAGSVQEIDIDLALHDSGALAQLVFGYLPASALAVAQGAVGLDFERASLLDALFAQPAPFVWYPDRF